MNTTIAISIKTRNQIKEFMNKEETYNDVLVRILNLVKEHQLQKLLMDTTNCITIKEAIEKIKR